LVVVQDKTLAFPATTVLGLALKLMMGLGVALTVTMTDCAAVPPAPVQVSL